MKETIKKCLFVGGNPKNAGGIETFGRQLFEALNENICFYSFYRTKNELYNVKNVIEIFPHKLIYRIVNKLSRGKVEAYYLNNIIKEYNIIIINNPRYLNKISKDNLDKKIILVQHQTLKSFLERKDYLNNNKKLFEKVRYLPEKLVTLSPLDKEEFTNKFNLKSQNVTYIRHCSKLKVLEEIKIKNKKLITICRLSNKHKRIDLMLEGMKKLQDFELEIWGDGPDRSYLENKMKDLGLKNAKFMGKTSDIKEKLDSASIFLMTSDYEGYPIAVIEAIKRGLPIVVRNTFTSSQDLVEGNGILLEKEWSSTKFETAIREIYTNYEKYNKKSIENAKKYEFEDFKEKWIKLIKNTKED